MKTLKIKGIIALVIAVLISTATFAQTTSNLLTKGTFKVSGNCDMCKKRIETAALTTKGVKTATWDDATQTVTVTYKSDKTSEQVIGQNIAKAGYDNDHATAEPGAYNKLPACCKYTRDKK
jgi:copper chaperone CopZ